QRAHMRIAEPRREPADQRLIDQDGIEIHRHLGDADAMTPRRYAGMQVSQRLAVGEPGSFRHEALDELQHPVGAVDEALENLVRVDASTIDAALVEEGLCPRRLLGRRQEHEREEISTLEMRAFFLKLCCPFGVYQRRHRIGKRACRIVLRGMAARFDKDRPARAKPAKRVVEARSDADEFGRRCAVKIGPAERVVRWKLPSLLRTMPSATNAAHGKKSARFCGLLRYSARLNMTSPHEPRWAG